jgi:hypothetical protein
MLAFVSSEDREKLRQNATLMLERGLAPGISADHAGRDESSL